MISRLFTGLFKHIDGFLFAVLCFALLVGLMVLYSASGQNFTRVNSQVINIVVAFGAMWVAANIPPHHLERAALPMFVVGVVLLIGVAFFGDISHGARRWLNLGVTKIQPSEIMRIAMPMMLAWYFSKKEGKPTNADFAISAVILAVPVLFIMKQPDLGTSLLVTASGFYIIFFAGLSWRILVGGALHWVR